MSDLFDPNFELNSCVSNAVSWDLILATYQSLVLVLVFSIYIQYIVTSCNIYVFPTKFLNLIFWEGFSQQQVGTVAQFSAALGRSGDSSNGQTIYTAVEVSESYCQERFGASFESKKKI